MKIATLGKGPRLDIVKALMDQNKVDYLSCDLSAKSLKRAPELADCFLIFLAIQSCDVRSYCQTIAPYITGRHAIVHMVHALESASQESISSVLESELSTQRFGFLTGPIRLQDVKKNLPSSALCASELNEIYEVVSTCLAGPAFRVYRSTDLQGAEIAAIYARVIAFCVGIAFELGDSVQSIIFARGLAEASRLIAALKGNLRTAFGLSGLANLHLAIGDKPSLDTQLGRAMTSGTRKKSAAAKVHFNDFQKLVFDLKCISESAGLTSDILAAADALVRGDLSPQEATLMSLPMQNDY